MERAMDKGKGMEGEGKGIELSIGGGSK